MKIINLIIIEDESSQIQVYEDVIMQFNKKNQINFSYRICKSFKEGEEALRSPNYDAAIIDLKLSTSEQLEGRELVKSVYQKLRIPIIIYSGSVGQIDDINENALLKKKLRTENLNKILEEIIEIYNTGITTFLRPDGLVDRKLTEIFWNHLSNDLDSWIKHNNPNNLLRYIFSHFQEHLELDIEGEFEEYHPSEVYIRPPIKKNLHTGDLIRLNNEYYLILTPACDIVIQEYKELPDGSKLEIRKAENLILVKAKEFDYKKRCLDKKGNLDKGKIKEYVTNKSYRFHYLPPFEKNNGFLIDFQEISSTEFDKKLDRVATIASPFLKDIIYRFGTYYSRQGQPTFNQDKIVNELFGKG